MTDTTEMRLAAERTALSWRRTCLGSVAVALLMLRAVLEAGWDPAALAPGGSCLVLLTVAAVGYRRNLALRRARSGSAGRAISWVTVAVALAALIDAGFALAFRG